MVFRNNTGTYLTISMSYNSAASGPATIIIPPTNSVTLVNGGSNSILLF